jgi:hypothetical protein
MNALRLLTDEVSPVTPCCRCAEPDRRWDRIAGKAYCPNCEEALALGEADPLIERTEKNRCSICNQVGTVRYLTFPLQKDTPVELHLCPEHLRNLLGRGLASHAFHQLRRQLQTVGLKVEEIFLLHEAFYDAQGRALQPALGSGPGLG